MFRNSFVKKLFFITAALTIASTCVVFAGKHTSGVVVKKSQKETKKEAVLLKVVAGCVASSPEERIRVERLLQFRLHGSLSQRCHDGVATPAGALVAPDVQQALVAKVSDDEVAHDIEMGDASGEAASSSGASQDYITVGDEIAFLNIVIPALEGQKRSSSDADEIDGVITALKNVKSQLSALDSSLLVTSVTVVPVVSAASSSPVVPAILPDDVRIDILPPNPDPTSGSTQPSFFRRHILKITVVVVGVAAVVAYLVCPQIKAPVDSTFGVAKNYVSSAAGAAKDFVCSSANAAWSSVRGFCSHANELLHLPQKVAALEAQNADLRRMASSCVTGDQLEIFKEDLTNLLAPNGVSATCSSTVGSCVTEEYLSQMLASYVKKDSLDALILDTLKQWLTKDGVAPKEIENLIRKIAEEAVKQGSLKVVANDILSKPGVSFAAKVLKWVFDKE